MKGLTTDKVENKAEVPAREIGASTPAAVPIAKKKGGGFADVAGMDELKRMVTEGFHKCAEPQGMCRSLWNKAAKPAVLRPHRVRKDILCRENGRGSWHKLHEGVTRRYCIDTRTWNSRESRRTLP